MAEQFTKSYVITPGNAAIDPVPKSIFVGTGGDITCRTLKSTANVVFKNVANGAILNIRAQYIYSATTATNIIGLA